MAIKVRAATKLLETLRDSVEEATRAAKAATKAAKEVKDILAELDAYLADGGELPEDWDD